MAAAPVIAQPLPHPVVPPLGLVVRLVDGQNEISLPEGVPGPRGVFYRTARPVVWARFTTVPSVSAVPGTPDTILALWNERGPDGLLEANRAISGAGGDFVAIGPIDYRVMLRFAEFDPVGLSTGSPGGFDRAAEPYAVGERPVPAGLGAPDVPGGCHLYIVQFWTQPLDEFRAPLAAAGGVIEDFLAWNSYIVRVQSEAARGAIAALPCVRWVGPYHPALPG